MRGRIAAIWGLTFREALRSRLFSLAIGFVGCLVLMVTPYAHATLGDPIAVIKHLGLAAASLVSITVVMVAGSTFLQKEFTRKTIYLLLARPLRRWEFLAGKFLGLTSVATTLYGLMVVAVIGYAGLLEGRPDWRLLWVVPYGISELAIVSAITILFSAIVVTPVLNGMFAFGIWIVGRSHPWLTTTVESSSLPILRFILPIIPDLSALQVADGLMYDEIPGVIHAAAGLGYGITFGLGVVTVAATLRGLADIP
jgi:ABC-type transport system involved in multi-copper enzyme maturation permease subunit